MSPEKSTIGKLVLLRTRCGCQRYMPAPSVRLDKFIEIPLRPNFQSVTDERAVALSIEYRIFEFEAETRDGVLVYTERY